MPSFAVNTKLGTAMVDSIGGPVRVNNLLSTLNIPEIQSKNLKHMENGAGDLITTYAKDSTRKAADEAYKDEMKDIADEESQAAESTMVGLIKDLGVSLLPDASPATKANLKLNLTCTNDSEWSDTEDVDENGSQAATSPNRYLFTPLFVKLIGWNTCTIF